MKLSSLSPQQSISGSDHQLTGSIVDHIFINALPKFVAERRNLIDVIKSVYQWNISRDSKLVAVWTLDLKNGNGSVYAGAAKVRPDCTISIDEKDSIGLFDGTLDPAKAFMNQKLKISGNLSAAHKFQQFFAEEVKHLRRQMSEQTSEPNACPNPKQEEALLRDIPTDGLKSDVVFNIIRTRMIEEPDLVKAFKFVIQFNITRNGKVVAVWTTDTKTEGGQVYRSSPKDVKPDAIVNVDDENYVNILFGKLNPQRAFMTGKIGVKGNILLLQKLDTFWNQVQTQRNDPELPIVKEIMLKDPLKPGLKSEAIVFDLLQKLVRVPNLFPEGSTVGLQITKDGRPASKWKLSFRSGERIGVLERADKDSNPNYDLSLTLDDNDFVRLTFNTIKLEDAIASGRVQYSGDRSGVERMSKLFSAPILKSRL